MRKQKLQRVDDPESLELERRPKQITGNSRHHNTPDGVRQVNRITESADFARPVPHIKPDGTLVWRIYASGGYAYESTSLERLMRGGLLGGGKRIKVIDYWPDGTRMPGPYHTGGMGWDGIVALFPDGKGGFERVGFKGYMVQPENLVGFEEFERSGKFQAFLDGLKARKAEGVKPITKKVNRVWAGNPTRSRHAARIVEKNGVEYWHDLGSVTRAVPSIDALRSPFRFGIDAEWVKSPKDGALALEKLALELERLRAAPQTESVSNQIKLLTADMTEMQRFHGHGYGGRPLMDANGGAIRVDGTYWFIYEQVLESKTIVHQVDGKEVIERIPYRTGSVKQRMKSPSEVYRPGEMYIDGNGVERAAREPIIMFDPYSPANPEDPMREHPWPGTIRGAGDGWARLFEGLNLAPPKMKTITVNGKRLT